MRRFTAELAFNALDKRQTPDGDRAAEDWILPATLLQRLERSSAIERLERLKRIFDSTGK